MSCEVTKATKNSVELRQKSSVGTSYSKTIFLTHPSSNLWNCKLNLVHKSLPLSNYMLCGEGSWWYSMVGIEVANFLSIQWNTSILRFICEIAIKPRNKMYRVTTSYSFSTRPFVPLDSDSFSHLESCAKIFFNVLQDC